MYSSNPADIKVGALSLSLFSDDEKLNMESSAIPIIDDIDSDPDMSNNFS